MIESHEWPGWSWRPDHSTWFAYIQSTAFGWIPPPSLGLDTSHLRESIGAAAEQHARWLVHPCLSVLNQSDIGPDAAHARLAVWAAVNAEPSECTRLGSVSLPDDTWIWASDGSRLAAAGTHDLAAFATMPEAPEGIAVPDPWGDSLPDRSHVGDLGDATWWMRLPLSPSDEPDLATDIHSLLVTQSLLGSNLPAASRWMLGVTSIIVPLVRSDTGHFRSGSIAGIPGIVFVEITSKKLLILEAMIHESAHLYFHLAEFGTPFIRAGHHDLYVSPLRPDPRPLRGIFLAYHALIYMCAFYRDWELTTGDSRAKEARRQLQQHRASAGEVLCKARANLSETGDAFLARCLEIVAADDSR